MDLVTAVVDRGLALGVVKDGEAVQLKDLSVVEVPSETYLQEIERVVKDVGGWDQVNGWFLRSTGESFTSLRGLVALVNILVPMHGLTLQTFSDVPAKAREAVTPVDPVYASEPNITLS